MTDLQGSVSRETFERLESYVALLEKWNPAINLVSKSTLTDVWNRHIYDSVQVYRLAPPDVDIWGDLGSGGGFPGLVCAILAAENANGSQVHLVESDGRKATFLRTVAREVGVDVVVHTERIEALEPLGADVLSARALAPLDRLLFFADMHLKKGGVALFPKGATFRGELRESLANWRFEYEECPSKTDDNSVILRIGDIERV